MTYPIILLDQLAKTSIETLQCRHFSIHQAPHPSPAAFIVRSTILTAADIPQSLAVIGRAGAGVNNIPIPTLTERGIPVLNTPGANANAVKELVIATLLIGARHIIDAYLFVQELKKTSPWDEKKVEQQKNVFRGCELAGKTLAVIGLGHIGVEVANAAHALNMKVSGFDPALSINNALSLTAAVNHASRIEDACAHADFVTIHVPLNDKTRHLFDQPRIAALKPNTILLNFSRKGVVDEHAVKAALDQKKLGLYICDFPSPDLLSHPKVICLPHLGASTVEAQQNCGDMICLAIKHFLLYGKITHSVNFPAIHVAPQTGPRLCVVNQNIPNMIAQLTHVLSQSHININAMSNQSHQDIAYNVLDLEQTPNRKDLETISKIPGVLNARLLQPVQDP